MAKEQTTYEDLQETLSHHKLAPVYLLYGAEDFLIEEATKLIVAEAVPEDARGFNLDVLHGEDADARDVVSTAASFPMMAERRAVVVHNADKFSPKDLEVLGAYIDKPSPSTCLVLTGTKPDMRKKPFVGIRKTGMAVEFRPLWDNQVPAWIAARVRRRKREITQDASRLLAGYVGTSLRELQNELEKVFIYVGDRPSIQAEDVAAVVGMSKEFTVFELQKSIGKRDLRRSALIMERMLGAGGSVPFIVVMLTNYFSKLYQLYDLRRRGTSDQELAAQIGVHPRFLGEYLEALARFPVAEIERAFALLVNADEVSKTTSSDPKQVMQLLLIKLLAKTETALS